MSIFEALFGKVNSNDDKAPEGICPNCWGRQKYDGVLKDTLKEHEIDVMNKDKFAQDAFIKNFVREHVSGIQLQNDEEGYYCPKCMSRA